jgi:hypothetical protein
VLARLPFAIGADDEHRRVGDRVAQEAEQHQCAICALVSAGTVDDRELAVM